jgi:hypothetical protein
MGLVTNSSRGVWSLTDDGQQLVRELLQRTERERRKHVRELWRAYTVDLRKAQREKEPPAATRPSGSRHQNSI